MPFYAEKLFLAINRDWGAQVALTKKIRGSRVARVQEGVRLCPLPEKNFGIFK